jgi:hypothetical protein
MRAALLSSDILRVCLESCGLVAYFTSLHPAVMACLDIREADSQSRWPQEVAATAGQVPPPLHIVAEGRGAWCTLTGAFNGHSPIFCCISVLQGMAFIKLTSWIA